tara:strand:- start:12934 stop:13242 length:309 start_codon:yes stop_codon:yes gene_type:complete
MTNSRIPQLTDTTKDDALKWFLEMRLADLLFDPNDDAEDIVHRNTGERLFSPTEAAEANDIINRLYASLGDELDEIVYPVYMEALGLDPYPEESDQSRDQAD